MGGEPVGAYVDADFDVDTVERQGVFHLGFDDFAHTSLLGFVQVEHQLVVNLKNHFCFEFFVGDTFMDAHPSDFYHVGRRTLNWHIYGVAFGKTAGGGIAAVDVGEVTTATEKGLRVAVLSGESHVAVDIIFDVRILCEVFVDEFGGLFARNAELFAEAKCTYAVHNAEVD